MRIDINELEILEPAAPAGPDPDAGAAAGQRPDRPAADLGERLRHWHRETLAREHRLLAD
ncbi:hypothetical protein OG407_49710 [Streptomyces sp. NBC_01515]|uniref:hypothetical protein n=1 Tax=Streptomyces sp. NBC_01515 TaxID=2903890 RepID=UPI0038669450